MCLETTMAAKQYRLQEWAAQIRECQSRPAGMSVDSWCACHGITKKSYYYRLRRVKEARLEVLQEKQAAHAIVPVQPELMRQLNGFDCRKQTGADISIKEFSVHVTESTPMPLLAAILQVIKDA